MKFPDLEVERTSGEVVFFFCANSYLVTQACAEPWVLQDTLLYARIKYKEMLISQGAWGWWWHS